MPVPAEYTLKSLARQFIFEQFTGSPDNISVRVTELSAERISVQISGRINSSGRGNDTSISCSISVPMYGIATGVAAALTGLGGMMDIVQSLVDELIPAGSLVQAYEPATQTQAQTNTYIPVFVDTRYPLPKGVLLEVPVGGQVIGFDVDPIDQDLLSTGVG